MAKPFSKFQDTDAAEHVQVTYANTKDAAQDLLVRVKETAQPILATARNVAQSTATNVKDVAQNTFTSAKGTTQHKLAKTKDLAQSTFRTTRNTTQDRLAKVQESTKVGLAKAQHLLAAGVSIAAALLYENLRIAQQKLQRAQVSLRQTATPIVEKTQDVVVTGTKKASESLQKAADNAKDVKEALQDGYAHYQRKRRRHRTLFRIGLLTGVVLTLFYTPLAGSDVRRRIVQQWQQYRSNLGF
jgi:hypothetical protein